MANRTPTNNAAGVVNSMNGSFTGAGNAETLVLGFIPQYVEVFNETDVILWKKVSTQAAANTMKITNAVAFTKDTGSAIVINTDGTVTLSATLAANGKVLHWRAQ